MLTLHASKLTADSDVRMFVLHSLAKECLCIPAMFRMCEDLCKGFFFMLLEILADCIPQ